MRVSVVAAVRLPDVPVMVTVAVPVDAAELAVRVSVLALVAGFGLNAAVTPLGKPEVERVTLPVNPFAGVMAIMLVAWLPCRIVRLAGLAERV